MIRVGDRGHVATETTFSPDLGMRPKFLRAFAKIDKVSELIFLVTKDVREIHVFDKVGYSRTRNIDLEEKEYRDTWV